MKRLFAVSATVFLAVAAVAVTVWAPSIVADGAVAALGARVRVVHGIPDAPAVDVYVAGNLAFANRAFKDITVYAPLMTGDRLVQVVVAGESDLSKAVFSQTLALTTTDYTIVAMGTLTTTDSYNAHLHVYEDNNAAPAVSRPPVRFFSPHPMRQRLMWRSRVGRFSSPMLHIWELGRLCRSPQTNTTLRCVRQVR